jgi:diguanylate cyclase (GGDEF)-like protein
MATILLLIHSGAERSLIRRHIGGGHTVLECGSGEVPREGFDAAIVDSLAFNRRQRELEERKKLETPAILPLLLLTDPRERTVYSSELGGLIDDILLPPVQKRELEAKLRNLLKLRELTLKQPGAVEGGLGETLSAGAEKALHACSGASRALLHAGSEQELLQGVCRAVVEEGGYPFAWAGYSDGENEYRVQACAGRGTEAVPWQEDGQGHSRLPSAAADKAVSRGKPAVLRDVASEETSEWRDFAQATGCGTAVGLPLMPDRGPSGALVVYAESPKGTAPKETELLERLAGDVTFFLGKRRERRPLRGIPEDVHQLAYYDELTRLPNREHLKRTLESTIASLKRDSRSSALLYIDLDCFKAVNDELGHRFGDVVLHQVAKRLSKVVRETDFLARIGGDEFILILEHRPRYIHLENQEEDRGHLAASAEKTAKRLLGVLEEPFVVQGREYRLNASIGISLYPYHDVDGSALINKADLAMYEAKKNETSSYAFYSSDFSRRRTQRLILETSLRQALNNGAFTLYYQPIFDLETGSVQGVEALVRWIRDEGLILPEEFLPVARRIGLIADIDAWVFSHGFRQLAEWRRNGLRHRLAVNVSTSRFRRPDFADEISRAANESGIDPSWVCLEISEESLLLDLDFLRDQMGKLHDLGFLLAIDDFGTGFSCLANLCTLPIDMLKIDRSFVRGLEGTCPSAPIIRSVLTLARNLGLGVVAEGVETPAQYRSLQEFGCESGQGYYLCSPSPGDSISEVFRHRKDGAAAAASSESP